MENKESENNKNLPEELKKNAFDKISTGIDKFKDAAGAVSNTFDKISNVASDFNNIQRTYIESQQIKSQTILGLKKIEEDHKTLNKHIDTEYAKQKHAMDASENVINAGLKDNDLEKIRLGLEHMNRTANHNPMADLKRSLDKEINFDDDDFMIEI